MTCLIQQSLSKAIKMMISHDLAHFLISVLLLLSCLQTVQAQLRAGQQAQWDEDEHRSPGGIYGPSNYDPDCLPANPYCEAPPFYPYDPIEVPLQDLGIVVGRSMHFHPYKYINFFMGVPYAKPPVEKRRFRPPEKPGLHWDQQIEKWDASYQRDVCPQEIWKYDDYYYEPRNVSEDCLHVNIYSPNITYQLGRKYPVMVFLHGRDYKEGDAMLLPGHIVAEKEIVVVTMNYRLGALGFLSTMDENSPGNYGLMDILAALRFLEKYIADFGGNPNNITLGGFGSGASAAALLTLSPKSKISTYKQLFHQLVLMGGADTCEWSVVGEVWDSNPLNYAKDLGRQVGCDADYGQSNAQLVDCLQYKHYEEIVNASANVYKKYGSLSGPFGPVVDGNILMYTPREIRLNPQHHHYILPVKILAGITRDAGAYFAENITKDIEGVNMDEGLDPEVFHHIIQKMVYDRSFILNNREVVGAMEFEYTFWAKPDNKSAVRQNLVDLYSDMMYGWCLDATLKSHLDVHKEKEIYLYGFEHRSDYETLPQWMGIPHGRDVGYFLGFPFFNETLGNITGIVPDQWDYTWMDKNISDFVTDMWVNFTKYGNPMSQWTRNTTWYPMTLANLSYLHINYDWSRMEINMRQSHYGFWRVYFPEVSSRDAITTTPQPTPKPLRELEIATWALAGVCIITIFVIAGLAITLRNRMKQDPYTYK